MYLSHDLDTDNGYHNFQPDQWNKTFDIFEKIKNRCTDILGDITEAKINDFIGKGRGCAIVVTEGGTPRPSKGIYRIGEFPIYDQYSDTFIASQMADDQIKKLKTERKLVPDKAQRKDKFHILSWTLTPELAGAIKPLALEEAYDPLFWKAYADFTPISYPNVLLMDFIGAAGSNSTNELLATAMAVNLQIASQNCYVGGGTNV